MLTFQPSRLLRLRLHLTRRTYLLPAHDVVPFVLQLLGQGIEDRLCSFVACPHHGEDAVRGVHARGAGHVVVFIAGVLGVEQHVHEEGGCLEGVGVQLCYRFREAGLLSFVQWVGVDDLVEGHLGGGFGVRIGLGRDVWRGLNVLYEDSGVVHEEEKMDYLFTCLYNLSAPSKFVNLCSISPAAGP